MASTTTITVRLSTELRDRLDRLASETRRSKSFLAADAIASYVEHELSIVDRVRVGLADAAAGRVHPHDDVMDEMDAIVEAAIARKTAKSA